MYKLSCRKPPLICLILLISFPSFTAVLLSPALPAMSDFFHVSNGVIQQLMTIFIIGYAFGQLIYSPTANRFGRKIAAYSGMVLYLFSCLVCLVGIYSHNLTTIIIGRLLMALGSSVGMIISYTIISDFYFPQQSRSVVSYAVLAYAFMPALANALGGLITSHLSWIDCFYFYLLYGLIIFITMICLPETLVEKDINALKIKPILRSYFHAFTNGQLLLFSMMYGLMAAFIYIIASGSPFIAMDIIKMTPAYYGTLLLIAYGGQIIGALSAGRLSKLLSAYQVIIIGYCAIIFGSILMLTSFLLHWINTWSLILPLFLIMIGLPMTYGSVTTMALMNYPDKATGSAIMSFITMLIALLFTFILTLLPNQNPLVMPSLFLTILVIAIIAFIHAKQRFPDVGKEKK